MSNNYDINDYIRGSLAELDVQPKPSSFDSVMRKLEKKRKRRFFILFFFGTAAFLLGTFYALTTLPVSTRAQQPGGEPAFKTSPVKQPSAREASKKINAGKHLPASQNTSPIQLPQPGPGAKAQKLPGTQKAFNSVSSINTVPVPGAQAPAPVANPGTTSGNSSGLQTPLTIITTEPQNDADNEEPLRVDEEAFVFLPPQQLALSDSAFHLPDTIAPALTWPVTRNKNGLVKNKKRLAVFVGISVTPQLSSYLFSENKQRNISYTASNADAEIFSKRYLKNKKDQNTFRFSYAYSIKLGAVINNRWELWIAAGQERFDYHEKFYRLTSASPTLTNPVYPFVGNTFAYMPGTSTINNAFRYMFYSLECNRLIQPARALRLKIGMGLKVSTLLSASYAYVSAPDLYYFNTHTMPFVSKTLYTINVNGGLIKDIGKRFQLRISPGIFYSPGSLFDQNYVIRQKRYGLEMDCMLAFKLF